MGTSVQWAKCWLLLSILGIINTTGGVAENLNGAEVEVCGLGPGKNSIEIEENTYINLTVHLIDQNAIQIKISHQQNNLSVDLCKFVRITTCEMSDYSNATYCKCLNNHTVQFMKKASSSDSGLYTWKWRDSQTPEKQKDIFINVKKAIPHTGNHSKDTASTATTATIVCVLLTVVGTATAGVVFRMRIKAKCTIEIKDCDRYWRSRGSDIAADNQVNDRALNNVNKPHSTVVIEFTANHSCDPNYADINDLDGTQHHEPNYADIKEQDKSQPLESYEMNVGKRSDDSPYAYVKRQGTSQSTDPTHPVVNSQDVSQPLDPYYSDIKESTLSNSYDRNHTDDKKHDQSPHYDHSYADINEHEASQPPDPFYSDVKKQHSSHSYDPNLAEVKKEEKCKNFDPIYAHVNKQTIRDSDNSTDAHVKTEDTNQPEDRLYTDGKKQDENMGFDTTYPHVKGQGKEQEGGFVYSPKNKQGPAQSHNPTHVRDKEDASDLGDLVYNHLHDICQHDDPNYAHIEINTRQLADLTFQQVKGHNDLSYSNVKKENTSEEDGLIYDHLKQQEMSHPDNLSYFHVNEEDTI